MLVGSRETGARAGVLSGACLRVMGWGVLAVVAIVPLLLDPSDLEDFYYSPKARALYLLAPVIAAAWVGRAVLNPALIDRRVLLPTLAFAGVAIVATWQSVDPAWSLWGAPWRSEGLLTLLAYAVIFLASATLRDRRFVQRWVVASLAGASLVAFYGIAQSYGYEWLARDPDRLGWTRAFATTGNPIFLGAYMVLMAPLAIAAVVAARSVPGLLASLGALVLVYLAALLTYSRAAWLSLALLLLATSTAVLWQRRTLPVRRYLWTLLLLLGLTTIFFMPPRIPSTATSLQAPAAVATSRSAARARSMLNLRDSSFRQRVSLWRVTLKALRRRPFLGYGPEALPLVASQAEHPSHPLHAITIDKAHNDTLDMAVSIGVLGVAAFWWLVAVSLGNAWRALRAPDGSPILGIACLAGIVGYLVDLQFGFSVVSVAPVFWSFLGIAAGLGGSAQPGAAR